MMFINSIFLPKPTPGQTIPEGITGMVGNFSHLFSNVFRIVKDEQSGVVPFQLAELSSETTTETQNQLLNISLFSNGKIVLDNQNISTIVSNFLSILNPDTSTEVSTNNTQAKLNNNTPKYFSLNKDELISEIKNIIQTLKKGDLKTLENVEISLIANNQSIQINPLTTNITELNAWIADQLNLNNDFEILAKSGPQKLVVDVEANKDGKLESTNLIQIISESEDSEIEVNSIPGITKTKIDSNEISKKSTNVQPQSQQPIEVLKSAIDKPNPLEIKTDNVVKQKQIVSEAGDKIKSDLDAGIKLTSELSAADKTLTNDELKSLQIKSQKVDDNNISIVKSKIEKPVDINLQNNVEAKSELKSPVEKTVSNSNHEHFKNSNSFSQPDVELKTKSLSINKHEPELVLNKVENEKSPIEVIVKELGKSETNIKVSSNQKFSSTSSITNKINDRVVLNDLLEKTNVKEIQIEVKESPSTLNKSYSSDNNEVGKMRHKIVGNDTIKIKADTMNYVSDRAIINKTIKVPFQQDLFVDSDLNENEQTVSPKSSTIQPIKSDSKSLNSNIVVKSDDKIATEKSNLFQDKAADVDVPKTKTEANTSETPKKIIPPELKGDLKSETIKVKVLSEESVDKNKVNISSEVKESNKINSKETYQESIKKSFIVEAKIELQGNPSGAKTKTVDDGISDNLNYKANKGNISVKSNSERIDKAEILLTNTSEKTPIVKDKSIIENLRSSIKELVKEQIKQEVPNKNQTSVENKNTKIDFTQRRVYSQIPSVEVISNETKNENAKILATDIELLKSDNKTTEETVKSTLNQIELKPKSEKQVWVKVSIEKNDSDVLHDYKKSAQQQNKITIDTNNDGMKNNSGGNRFSENDHQSYSKSKPQIASVESSQTIEVKTVSQNQTTAVQQDLTANIKPEIKIEQMGIKPTLHSDETKFGSRAAELVEKVKFISAGEMIREVNKIFESGEKQSIVLRLVPKELGSVKVMLDTIDNVLTAKVEVENETVGQIVRNNVDQLKQNLLQSGVHLNSINISYHNSDQKQHGFNNQKRKNSAYEQNIETEDIDESIIAKKMGYNTYEYLV